MSATVLEVRTPWGDAIEADSEQLTQLPAAIVRFSEAMNADSVEAKSNWRLSIGGVDASDLIHDIHYTEDFAQLTFSRPLRAAEIQLTALETMVDQLGEQLDGDANGAAGGDFAIAFDVQQGVFAVGPAKKVFDVAQPASLGQFQLGLSAEGGFALGMVEFSAGSLLYEGTPVTTVPNRYSPSWDYPRAYLQMFDDGFEKIGPLRSEFLQDLFPVVPVEGDHYQLSGQHSLFYGGYTVVWQMTPSGATSTGDLDPVVDPSLKDRVFRAGVSTSGTSSNYVSRLFVEQFRAKNGQVRSIYTSIGSLVNGDYKEPAFDQNDSGDYVLVWAQRSKVYGPFTVFARKFDVNGNPLTPAIVVDSSDTDQAKPSVGLASDGSFLVSWTTLDGTVQKGAFVRRFAADGSPLGDIRELVAPAESIIAAPSILMDSEDRALLYWANEQNISMLSTSATLADFDRVQTLEVAPDRKLRRLFSTTSTQGDFLLGWLDEARSDPGSPGGIYVQEFSFGHGAAVDLNGAITGRDFASSTKVDGSPTAIGGPISIVGELTDNITSATIRIRNPLPGDLLAVDTTGTNLSGSYADGVLSITGVDTLENYERVLQTATYASTAARGVASFVEISTSVNDGYYEGPASTTQLQVYIPGSNRVVNRYISYKGQYDSQYSYYENIAIPPDKEAYLPGSGLATFANITGYDRGINRIVVEAYGQRAGITPADFTFRVGTSADPSQWVAAPAPSKITIGTSRVNPDRDRITIEWADGAIKNTWLEVTLAANVRTGLAQPDVFYYGNLVGDTGSGNSPLAATTSTVDMLAVRRFRKVYPDASNPYDLNRDRKIDVQDEALVRANFGILRMLNLPAPGAATSAAPRGAEPLADALAAVAAALAQPPTTLAERAAVRLAELPLAAVAPRREVLDVAALALAYADEAEPIASAGLDDGEERALLAGLATLPPTLRPLASHRVHQARPGAV